MHLLQSAYSFIVNALPQSTHSFISKGLPMPLTGRCLCGAVSYTSDSEPQSVTYCHCDDCRRVGSAFNVGVCVPASTFQLSGKTKGYESTNDEGHTKIREFCPECGSQLFTRYPDLVFIKAGTLDHSENLQPTREIWTEMTVPWSKIPDGLDKFPRSSTWGNSQPGTLYERHL